MSDPLPVAPATLAATYREQRRALLRLGYLLSGSRETAEDAVQAVFADVAARWDGIDDHRAYLRRAVVNRVKDGQRRTLRRRPVPVESSVTGIPDVDETWSLVRRLPSRQREVVVLRFYEDLSLAQIAELLGRNHATVRSDLRRALTRLRGTLDA